ncbi:nitrate reductase molybdenum cofactor assembly chaperone [Geothermobacter hydrogeniphilus]|uniref:Nitrate reductase molybdenum cofactor assembly chaperone n=1 Tax=Geothermobacter hydrogeniphilus TaxID=1969733 RepID=A0A2K2HDV7_9BACT|nr:nitrate reductase molybdenum cofactor assembly chaperone [Geothermobacter hydrogeniphilus]PNU21439.1 nitrate reductase molybdenum cofactor assembly chaperone [Geothermobacter hydrogeniphilus]
MLELPKHQEICRQFAGLLAYPDEAQLTTLDSLSATLQPVAAEAAEMLHNFAAFREQQAPSRVEEVYTSCFDLQPSCHPYVGYQLCGESQARILFLMQLKKLYREHGFSDESELPDHLVTMLRFLGSTDDQACRDEIIADGLRPALEKLVAGFDGEEQPYLDLLQALRSFLNLPLAAEGSAAGPEKECDS